MCFEKLIFEATNNIRNFDDFYKTRKVLENFNIDISLFHGFKKRNKDLISNNVNKFNYSKIKLFENNVFDIYVIFWFEKSESPYHDHAKHGCYYKLLEGSFEETILKDNKIIGINNLKKNDIGYIDNVIGYHKIKNTKNHIITDKDKVEYFKDATISIHFYSPPNYQADLL